MYKFHLNCLEHSICISLPQGGSEDAYEMQPVIMEEVIEQCDSKVHDGCYIFSSIEEYSFNYTLGEVNLIGKGISLDVEKGCATYNNFMKNNKTIE